MRLQNAQKWRKIHSSFLRFNIIGRIWVSDASLFQNINPFSLHGSPLAKKREKKTLMFILFNQTYLVPIIRDARKWKEWRCVVFVVLLLNGGRRCRFRPFALFPSECGLCAHVARIKWRWSVARTSHLVRDDVRGPLRHASDRAMAPPSQYGVVLRHGEKSASYWLCFEHGDCVYYCMSNKYSFSTVRNTEFKMFSRLPNQTQTPS